MALVTYPLNNIDYSAEDAELFHVTRTSGIYAKGSFGYSITGTDNNIVIGTGIGWIKNSEFSGKVIAQKEAISLDMGLPDPVYPRIDAIVIQFDNNRNETNIVVKKGTAKSNPVAPSVVQNESVYELHLYHVRREAGSLYIKPGNIADLRLNSSYCGLMADSITNIDTTTIEKQVSDLIKSLQDEISSVKDGSAYLHRDGSTNMTGNLPMDGHKVTGLGTPTADGDAVPLGYARKIGNPHNLLDNSDFRNPVNQRGITTHNGWGYSIDRWFTTGGENGEQFQVSVEDGYVKLYNGSDVQHGLEQRFVHGILDQNKVYTVAYKDYYGNVVVSRASIGYYPEYGVDALYFPLNPGETRPVVWIALYEGEYTAETLPEYQPKGYGVELAECLRYYRILNANGVGNGYTTGDGGMSILLLPFSVRSGVQPTFVCDGTIYTRANGVDYASTIDGFTTKSGYMELVFMANGAPAKHAAAFYTDGTKAAISADL